MSTSLDYHEMGAEIEDINRVVHNILTRFGDDALREADKRIYELSSKERHDAAVMWRRIRVVLRLLIHDQAKDSRR